MQKLQCLFVICVEAIIYMFLYNLHDCSFDPIQDWLFWGCSRMREGGGSKKAPLPKICLTYPTTMKLGTVIPYLKKIETMHETRDTSLEIY